MKKKQEADYSFALFLALLLILAMSCARPRLQTNASLSGVVVKVQTEKPGKYKMWLRSGADTVVCLYGANRKPKIGQTFSIQYDTTCTVIGRKAIIKSITK